MRNNKSITVLACLFVVFLLPFLTAQLFYARGINFLHRGGTQHGYLIQPPLDIHQLNLLTASNHLFNMKRLRGKWLLLYVAPNPCLEACKKNLFFLQQLHIALGKDQARLLRILITLTPDTGVAPAKALAIEKAGFDFREALHLRASTEQFSHFIAALPMQDYTLEEGGIYVGDPLGNIILYYAPTLYEGAAPKDLFKDIKHLLGVSQIG